MIDENRMPRRHACPILFQDSRGHGPCASERIIMGKKNAAAGGLKLNYKFAPRRAGDVPVIYADPTLANTEMGWKATRAVEDTLKAAWAWELHLAGK